uniref:Uncharacterized protein n=1 Tax=Rhipicephalus microplus TaxID=6941 RepID=A0A6G5AI92_RHIMP
MPLRCGLLQSHCQNAIFVLSAYLTETMFSGECLKKNISFHISCPCALMPTCLISASFALSSLLLHSRKKRLCRAGQVHSVTHVHHPICIQHTQDRSSLCLEKNLLQRPT